MTREELIEKMVKEYERVVRAEGIRPNYLVNRPGWMSAVLDLLTKEAVEGRIGYQTLDEDARPWRGTPIAGEEVDVIAFGTGRTSEERYPLTGNPGCTSRLYDPGTEVQAIILELPPAPSASKRAAGLLREMGGHLSVTQGMTELMGKAKRIADELEKEARDATDES